jgi:alpha-amylase/alpha-mannosidase (GH57 family)
MPALRVVILWHQHQPFYKDLVSGDFRLPWVRLHALKDYYGMVKLLEEFPQVHQTFNLVPSLITQIQEYVAGNAQDPFFRIAAKPARDLDSEERRFALQYLFQAHPVNMIGRYPRYQELFERYRAAGFSPERAERFLQAQDFADLQVLSQIAWFDEFFLEDPEVAALVKRGKDFTAEEQKFVLGLERELMAKVLPAHAEAAMRGGIEISTSPFYHPILPLVCDTNQGGVSTPGLPLPENRFQHPEDAREQIVRGLDLHEQVFGMRPRGMWPSEGSVSDEAVAIAATAGVTWMATDEGVLGRSLGVNFGRDGGGRLPNHLAEKLYTIHRYENGPTAMHMLFRDHTMSDLVGFVYSSMAPAEAASHLMRNIKEAAQPLLNQGRDALVPIILDGENAWEYYPRSGREFLRRFYEALQHDPEVEAVTISEAIAGHREVSPLGRIVPGSWINANFNVWIGAPEDNRSWDYLYRARELYTQSAAQASEAQRKLAYEELLIAEGSDWNWWYGPEHHSANDRDFDELYRKHLSNVYQALGATPPDYLSQPLFGGQARPAFTPQTAYIRPKVTADKVRYFEWLGAARYTADHRSGAMHGKQFLLDSVYAGIDDRNVYGRLDFAGDVPQVDFALVVNLESWAVDHGEALHAMRLDVEAAGGKLKAWKVTDPKGAETKEASETATTSAVKVAVARNFEFKMPLSWLVAPIKERDGKSAVASLLKIRMSLWQNGLPVDALPVEGWIELHLLPEPELIAMG